MERERLIARPPAHKLLSVQMGAMKGLLVSRLPAFRWKMTSIFPLAPVGAPPVPPRFFQLYSSPVFVLPPCLLHSLAAPLPLLFLRCSPVGGE